MAQAITAVNTSSDTFQIWINRTNEMANAISTTVVTVNTHANGALTTSNGFVNGHFGANTLTARDGIRGGTVQTPTDLTISSNVIVATGNTLSVGNSTVNIVANSTTIIFKTAAASIPLETGLVKFANATIGTTAQNVDSFSKTLNRGAEYLVTVKDTNDNAYHISKLLVVHDSDNAYTTEYGVVYSNNSLGVFGAITDGTNVVLQFTPTVANTRVSGTRIIAVI